MDYSSPRHRRSHNIGVTGVASGISYDDRQCQPSWPRNFNCRTVVPTFACRPSVVHFTHRNAGSISLSLSPHTRIVPRRSSRKQFEMTCGSWVAVICLCVYCLLLLPPTQSANQDLAGYMFECEDYTYRYKSNFQEFCFFESRDGGYSRATFQKAMLWCTGMQSQLAILTWPDVYKGVITHFVRRTMFTLWVFASFEYIGSYKHPKFAWGVDYRVRVNPGKFISGQALKNKGRAAAFRPPTDEEAYDTLMSLPMRHQDDMGILCSKRVAVGPHPRWYDCDFYMKWRAFGEYDDWEWLEG